LFFLACPVFPTLLISAFVRFICLLVVYPDFFTLIFVLSLVQWFVNSVQNMAICCCWEITFQVSDGSTAFV
jgi:hypothetical protein